MLETVLRIILSRTGKEHNPVAIEKSDLYRPWSLVRRAAQIWMLVRTCALFMLFIKYISDKFGSNDESMPTDG